MITLVNSKLILFEGIPGSGKTTTSQILNKHLINNGIESEVYTEGSVHPIDLPYYAYLSVDEFNELLLQYPLQAKWLRQNTICEEEYMLTPYKVPEPNPWNDTLVQYLRSKELCYSDKASVTFSAFKNVFYRRFEYFSARATIKDSVTILESVLFQHQIHDINRLS